MTPADQDAEELDSIMFTCVDVIIAILTVALCAGAAWWFA